MSIPRAIEFEKRTSDPAETVPAGEAWFYCLGDAFKYKDDDQQIHTLAVGVTREEVEDLLQNSFPNTADIDVNYNDAGNVFEFTVSNALKTFLLSRANHTGSQAISTVSGLQTALDSKADESIQINSVAGETTGGGDLTTNRTIGLANVGSAGSSSSASETLDVTVDVKGRVSSYSRTAISILSSAVTDFANAVRGTILTGLSVATSTAVVASDSILVAIGKLQGQLNNIYSDCFDLSAGIATNLAGFQNFINHNFTLPSNGDYIVTIVGAGSINATDNDLEVQVTFTNNAVTTGPTKVCQIEGKDSGGTGPIFSAVEGGTLDTGTDQLMTFSYQVRLNSQVSGTLNVDLEFQQGAFDGNDEVAIHQCSVKVERVNS